jgi:hypothetical protein
LIAELAPRACFGLGTGNAGGDQIVGASVQMKLPLLNHVAFHATAEHEGSKERSQFRQHAHTSSGTAAST